MAINVSYTPIQTVADLATQAGNNDAQRQINEEHFKVAAAKYQHDNAMQEMEFHAQTQADAQFREQHFQRALAGEQFRNHELTLEEQYGWNIKLDRAKSDITLQAKIQEHSQKVQEWTAQKKQIEDSQILNQEQKAQLISAGDMELSVGASVPSSVFNAPTQVVTTYDPVTQKNVLQVVDKSQLGVVGEAKKTETTPQQMQNTVMKHNARIQKLTESAAAIELAIPTYSTPQQIESGKQAKISIDGLLSEAKAEKKQYLDSVGMEEAVPTQDVTDKKRKPNETIQEYMARIGG